MTISASRPEALHPIADQPRLRARSARVPLAERERPCRKCGALFTGFRAPCPPCKKAVAKARREATPDQVKVRKERWRKANSEKERARQVKRYADNPQRVKDMVRRYREENPEASKARLIKHKQENREAYRTYGSNRRAREAALPGKLSPDLGAKLFRLQQGKCACCRLPLGDDYQLDHILPVALGGANVDRNIQLLRRRCNLKKSAKHPVDYMQSLGLLL
jgi:hypothetical protein